MEEVDVGFTLEVTDVNFKTDSEVELKVKALSSTEDVWVVVDRSFNTGNLFKNGRVVYFEYGHPNLSGMACVRERLERMFTVAEHQICFALMRWDRTDVTNEFILSGHITGPFGHALKEALIEQKNPVYFWTRAIKLPESYIVGVDYIQTTKRKDYTPDQMATNAVQKMAMSVKPSKRNWVIYNPETKKYLGRVPNVEAENYPLPCESETVFGWVDNLQDAKANWIIYPPRFVLTMMHGLNLDGCLTQRVTVVGNVITLED